MHVVVICEYGTRNGGENSLLACLAHCPADVRVTVLAPAEGRLARALAALRIAHVPCALHDSHGRRLDADQALAHLESAVRRLRPDVVHANSLSMGRLTGQLAGRMPVPCTAHLRDIVRLSSTAAAHLNGNRRLIAVSAATRAFHFAQGLDAQRIDVVYNGIDCDRVRPPGGRGTLRAELSVPERTLLAATIGQIGIRKGLDVLVESAILATNDLPNVSYLIIGERTSTKAESVAFEESLHARLREAGIADRFHWLGYREDVERLLGAVDLLIHPARQEPFGRVLLEAAACGLPIVATRVGGTEEMLADGESALLVDAGDGAALAHAIRQLAHDDALRARLGDAARRRIAGRFDIRQRAAELFNLWRTVASSEV